MDPLGFISIGALRQYLDSARSRGVDIRQALKLAGVDQALLIDPEYRLPGRDFERLLEILIDASDDPLFGLHTGERVPPDYYNVMGYIALGASSLLEALSTTARYEKKVADLGSSETRLEAGRPHLLWHCRYPRQPVRRHLIETVFGNWLRYTRWLTGRESLAPAEVWFQHAGPSLLHQHKEYERVFQCPVRFEQPCSALIADADLIHQPLRYPEPELLFALAPHAQRQLEALGVATSMALRVRQILQEALGGPLPDRDQVARALRLNTRTLHRRLSAEGTGWRAVLDQVRADWARRRLLESTDSQEQIARELGYADIRCFQRSFKRHTGDTPGRFRRRATSA